MWVHAALGDAGSAFKDTMSSLVYSSESAARSAGFPSTLPSESECLMISSLRSIVTLETQMGAAEQRLTRTVFCKITLTSAQTVRVPRQGLSIAAQLHQKGLMQIAHWASQSLAVRLDGLY